MEGRFTIFDSNGNGPYQGLPQYPEPPQEGDDEWRARARGRTWYHTTPADNAEVIEREGLEPGGEECVHLSIKPMEQLIQFLFHAKETVVYVVSLDGLPDEAVTPGWDDMEYCLAVMCPIPPENLRLANRQIT